MIVIALATGDLLAVGSRCLAFAMSRITTAAACLRVIVDGDKNHLVRPRETIAELFARESPLP
jgi:hypothetical protein